MRVPERQLLAPMDRAERVVDVANLQLARPETRWLGLVPLEPNPARPLSGPVGIFGLTNAAAAAIVTAAIINLVPSSYGHGECKQALVSAKSTLSF
jgi:hypothetical protein